MFDRDLEESRRLDILNTTHKERAGLLAKLQTEASVSDRHRAVGTSPDWFSHPLSYSPILTSYLVLYSPELWVTSRTSAEDNSSKK